MCRLSRINSSCSSVVPLRQWPSTNSGGSSSLVWFTMWLNSSRSKMPPKLWNMLELVIPSKYGRRRGETSQRLRQRSRIHVVKDIPFQNSGDQSG